MKKLACKTVISTAFTLLLAEAALRLIQPVHVFSSILPLYPHLNKEIHSHLRGVTTPTRMTTNKWGLRGDEPPADWTNWITVLTIGGSTTHCYVIDDQKTWPALLQKKMRENGTPVWVGNAGLHGHSTVGHTVLMSEIATKIKPNYIIFLVGLNDALLPDEAALANRQFDAILFLRSRSRLAQMAYTLKKQYVDRDPTVVEAVTGYVKGPSKDGHVHIDTNRLVAFQSRLESLIRQCAKINARPIFATQPLPFDDTCYWDQFDSWCTFSNYSLSASNLAALVESYNQTTIETCNKNGVECIDLGTLIPHSEEYFYDNCHLNDAGCEMMSKKIRAALAEIQEKE